MERYKGYPGKMVVLEGIDGSGKTTAASGLCAIKPASRFAVASPSRGLIGAYIRCILAGEESNPGPWPLQLMFAVDRYRLQSLVYEPLLHGKTVICDRWWYSAVAYGEHDGLSPHRVYDLYRDMLLIPDLVIHLQVPAEIAVMREGKGAGSDLYDGNLDRQRAIAKNYERLPYLHYEEWHRSRTRDEWERHGESLEDQYRPPVVVDASLPQESLLPLLDQLVSELETP